LHETVGRAFAVAGALWMILVLRFGSLPLARLSNYPGSDGVDQYSFGLVSAQEFHKEFYALDLLCMRLGSSQPSYSAGGIISRHKQSCNGRVKR